MGYWSDDFKPVPRGILPNPYLDAFIALPGSGEEIPQDRRSIHDYVNRRVNRWDARRQMVTEFAWAIPNDQAILTCVKYSPLIEVGAGAGYWAYLIEQNGGRVLCTDRRPGKTHAREHGESTTLPKMWHRVRRAHSHVARRFPAMTLLICWPPYHSVMASSALRAYTGRHVIYVGEGGGGCTGDEVFHKALERDWTEIEEVRLPSWEGIRDNMWVYERKSRGRPGRKIRLDEE